MARIQVANAMPAPVRPEPRKQPVQARSRATVRRIVEAATRVLIAEGYAAASTNRIAAEAGLSPGSVYQYFPNKDAIVFAAVERMTEELSAPLVEALRVPFGSDRPLVALERVLAMLLEVMERHRQLVRIVVEELPRLGGSPALSAFEQRIRDLATGYLAGLARGGDPLRPGVSVWITVQCVEQLTIRYVLEQPPIPREDFVAELRRLITRYTAGAGRAG